jgi:tRNA pseudouridine55 synthase
MKYKLKKLKVGHAGTLDPLATGLLLICTGKMTKKISEIQALEKAYTGIITLGATTPSYDLETAIDQNFFIKHITKQQLDSVRKKFVGEIDQYPPIYSAIKKEGKRLYEYARKGEEIKIESRKVTLYAFDFTKIDIPKVHFHVRCSKGTYIRSLAHDFGKELESGAHLSQLRRTAIGAYTVEDSLTPDQISEKLDGI